ncbi:alpha/beta-hydrolase [Morchella conica CCBAS932]|uniref:Alpha/beta-hydrolase n=1 Tax=Morchella conica CCBAS932 TaxID=1392247 RepID=A0A3N4KWH1_9PEZI|nr:alpha/beta-hydrolase [Morchella conica CCBAS932]
MSPRPITIKIDATLHALNVKVCISTTWWGLDASDILGKHIYCDLTLLFCHANGFPKELYEPFFTDLHSAYSASGQRIRSIWALDAAHQGASGILNERHLGDEPSWNDLPRDVLHAVNTFAAQMPAPLVGVGHSFGGHAVVRAALMHPGLFEALVLLDPVVEENERFPHVASHPAAATARRRDICVWRSSGLGLDGWLTAGDGQKHGFRALPTAIYPDATGVTLATTKHQEVYTFLRRMPDGTLGRPEPGVTFRALKQLVPPVLYIVGSESTVCIPEVNQRKMENTPKAEMEMVEGAGHLVPMEAPGETAALAARYLVRLVKRWGKGVEKDEGVVRERVLGEEWLGLLAKL